MGSPRALRRELLFYLATLFVCATLVATVGSLLAFPLLRTPGGTTLFVVSLVVGNVVVLLFFGRWLLRSHLFEPLDHLVRDARRIAGGEYHHRVAPADSLELRAVSESVNAVAERLIHDQELLAENIQSLEDTNRELGEVRNQVIQAARLASVGTLAAGIAHEVGNPLGAIMAYADLASSRAEQDGRDTEILDGIRGEAWRIDRIIRGLLDYARPKRAELTPVPVEPTLERVRDLMDAQGRLDRVEDLWSVGGDVPLVVMDPHRLEQVLVNLLLNAVDAVRGAAAPRVEVELRGEPGPGMTLPSRRESDPPGVNYAHRRRLKQEGGGIGVDRLLAAERVAVITVTDNGPGLPAEEIERVFDPFFTTKDPGEGTGLGLAICAQLVEGMGGRIEAAAAPAGGARFTIRLPGASRDPGNGKPEGGPAGHGR